MLKLSFSEPKYVDWTTKEGNHVVKCIYRCVMHNTDDSSIIKKFVSEGYSTCSPNDTFDMKTGRIIADSRAKSNAYATCLAGTPNGYIHNVKKAIKKLQDNIDFVKKVRFLKAQEGEHLKYVLKGTGTVAE